MIRFISARRTQRFAVLALLRSKSAARGTSLLNLALASAADGRARSGAAAPKRT